MTTVHSEPADFLYAASLVSLVEQECVPVLFQEYGAQGALESLVSRTLAVHSFLDNGGLIVLEAVEYALLDL